MNKIENKHIADILLELTQGIDVALRQARGEYCRIETDLNSKIEEYIQAVERIRQKIVKKK